MQNVARIYNDSRLLGAICNENDDDWLSYVRLPISCSSVIWLGKFGSLNSEIYGLESK